MNSEITFLDKTGRLVVPVRFRKEMGWEPGDKVTLEVIDQELRVVSVKQAIRSAQELVARHVPAGVSLADELIRERHEEAQRDDAQPPDSMPPARELESARG